MTFKPEFSWEFLSADEIEAKSVRALRNHVRHVKEASPYYRKALAEVDAEDIQSAGDFARLPFTGKTAVAANPSLFLAVPPDRIAETLVTGGSGGKPLTFSMTAGDMDRAAFGEALGLHSAGVTPGDRAQIWASLDQASFAAMAAYRGLALLGVNTARIGLLPPEMHRLYLESMKPTVLTGIPSSLKKLADGLAAAGLNRSGLCVQKIFCMGEAVHTVDMGPTAAAKFIEEFFNAKVFSTYGNTGLSLSYYECMARNGCHAHPELAYTEIVNDTGGPAAAGTPGEIVLTPLGVEGTPLLRYKTGDIACRIPRPCECGRNSMKIGPILGRKSQLFRVRGATFYPLGITAILDGIEGIEDYLIILEDDDGLSDKVALHVATPPANLPKISGRIRAELHVNLPMLISNKATISHYRRKSSRKIRVLDLRTGLAGKAR